MQSKILLSLIVALAFISIPTWELYWNRRRRNVLRAALPVSSVIECVFAIAQQEVGRLPTIKCINEDAIKHFKVYGRNCYERCNHSVSRNLIGTSELGSSEIASLLSKKAVVQRIGMVTILALVPTLTAIVKIWEK